MPDTDESSTWLGPGMTGELQSQYYFLTHVIERLAVEGRGVAGPVDKEEATEDNDGHGEEDSTIERMLMQTEYANHLKIINDFF